MDRESDGLRAEFEVRVIDGLREVPSLDEGQGVEIGLRIGAGRAPVETEVEVSGLPVHRLNVEEAATPVRARRLSEAVNEVGRAAPYVPRRPRRVSMTAWTAGMATVTGTLAVAAVAGVLSAKKPPRQDDMAVVFSAEKVFGEEKGYFLENTFALTREAEALLDQYAAATSPDEVLPMVRDAEGVKDRLQALWRPMGGRSRGLPVEALVTDSEVRPALLLKGTKSDFSPFKIFFVRENDQLKIDWEGSFGIGDSQLQVLKKSKTVGKGAKMRVVVEPSSYYTTEFPETDYRSYRLVDATGEESVYGFARRSSRTAELLAAEFNEGSILLAKTATVLATLRIAGPLPEGENLFEITEMLHKGWVSP